MVLVPRCFTCPNDKVELRLNAVTILKVFCGFFRTDDLQMRLFEQPAKRGVLTPLGHQLVVTGAIFNKSWHQSQGTPIWTQLTRKTGKTDHLTPCLHGDPRLPGMQPPSIARIRRLWRHMAFQRQGKWHSKVAWHMSFGGWPWIFFWVFGVADISKKQQHLDV